MAPRTLPGLGLSAFWNLGEDGWKDGMDANLLALSALVQGTVLSRTTALPGSPTNGMIYVVPHADATNPDKIALRDNGAWVYIVPKEGFRLYVADEDIEIFWNGSSWFTISGLPTVTSQGGKYLRVKSDASGVEWVNLPASALPSIVGAATKILAVKADESGVEWVTKPSGGGGGGGSGGVYKGPWTAAANLPTIDFEDGTIPSDFVWSGVAGSIIVQADATGGKTKALRTPATADGAGNYANIPIHAATAGTAHVRYASSSENSYDFASIWLDDVVKDAVSGGGGFRQVDIPLAVGDHIIRFQYAKDGGGAAGLDCGLLSTIFFDGGGAADGYIAGDTVSYNGRIYLCLVSATAAVPGANGDWKALTNDEGAHRYWALRINTFQNNDYQGLSWLQFRESAGGPQAALGGVARTDRAIQDGDVASVFTTTDATSHEVQYAGNAVTNIFYDMPAGKAINVKEVFIATDRDVFSRGPISMELRYSDNGVDYITKESFTARGWTATGDVQTFTTRGGTRFVTAGDTVLASDVEKKIMTSSGAAITETIPLDLPMSIGEIVTFINIGAGQLTIAGASGVTISPPSTFAAKSRYQFAMISLMKIGRNVYTVTGALADA